MKKDTNKNNTEGIENMAGMLAKILISQIEFNKNQNKQKKYGQSNKQSNN